LGFLIALIIAEGVLFVGFTLILFEIFLTASPTISRLRMTASWMIVFGIEHLLPCCGVFENSFYRVANVNEIYAVVFHKGTASARILSRK